MAACCAYGCNNRFSKKIKGITFHRFPENPEQRDAWISAVQRKNWRPSRSTRICSEHFSEDQIDRTSYFRVRLRENAVPNIFKSRRPFGKKRGERDKDPEKEKMSSEFCRIAMRPSKTAPLVISVKPASTATVTSMTTTINTTAASNLVTSSAAALTTALPINLFPQILSASGTPILTSPMPSIIATNVGNFLTTGLSQAVTLPISTGLTTPINPTQPMICKEEKTVSNGSSFPLITSKLLSLQEEKLVDKLQRRNLEYCKKIRTLQQKVRRQQRVIERLSSSIKSLRGEKGFDGDKLLTECLMSAGSDDEDDNELDTEFLMDEQADVTIKTEVRSSSPEDNELNFEDLDLLDSSAAESCTELLEKAIKSESRTISPNEILP